MGYLLPSPLTSNSHWLNMLAILIFFLIQEKKSRTIHEHQEQNIGFKERLNIQCNTCNIKTYFHAIQKYS